MSVCWSLEGGCISEPQLGTGFGWVEASTVWLWWGFCLQGERGGMFFQDRFVGPSVLWSVGGSVSVLRALQFSSLVPGNTLVSQDKFHLRT